ncbi:MAG: class I SAM-dependent methyltransferase [Nocardioidaceae bacterium]
MDLLDLRPGERVLDVGCGRGAVTLPAAAAVGDSGSVTGIDVSSAMVERTRAAAHDAGLAHVDVQVGDATALDLPLASYDVVASSPVLFFLPQAAAALPGWVQRVRPGGRMGFTTFGEQDDVWRAVDALFLPHLPASMVDPRTRTTDTPFGSDEGVEALVATAGGQDVRTVGQHLAVVFDDAERWRAWTMSTGQRMMWGFVPEGEREPLFEQAAALLEQARAGDRIVLHQEVRHTLAGVG